MQTGKRGKEIWFPEFLGEMALQFLVWSGSTYSESSPNVYRRWKWPFWNIYCKIKCIIRAFARKSYLKFKYPSLAANDNLTHAHTIRLTWNDLKGKLLEYWRKAMK